MDASSTVDTVVKEPASLVLEVPFTPSSREQVDFAALTHAGKVRSSNQDSYLVYRVGRFWEPITTSLPRDHLPARYEACGYGMAVADGMGGHQGGEVASRMALRTAVALILNAARWALRLDDPAARQEELEGLITRGLDIFRQVSETIAWQALSDPTLSGMGTTLTAAYSSGADLIVFHVGDSRAYLYRGGQLQQLTRDHTVAQEMVEEGRLPAEEAGRHPLCHVLTRAIGGRGYDIRADVHHVRLLDGDSILLCSDGLTNMVPDSRITSLLGRGSPIEAACQDLVDEALTAGGKDNITVLLARYHFPAQDATLVLEKPGSSQGGPA